MTAGWMGVAVALGCGLLIGVERERRKGIGPERGAAGVRTFIVVALLGAAAGLVAQPGLVAVTTLGIFALGALSYRTTREEDPGVTTEVALVLTHVLGVLAVARAGLAAALGAVLALVLWLRDPIHRVVTEKLNEKEIHDGLLLAAIGLVVLPLTPGESVAWLGGIAPRTLVQLLLTILVLQAAGHVARRLLGARAGLALSGFLGGFVSSTATIGSMGSLARADRQDRPALTGAAVLSSVATWIQILVMAAAIAPRTVPGLAPLAAAAVLPTLLIGTATTLRAKRVSRPVLPTGESRSPLRLREALVVSALLALVSAGMTLAQRWAGDTGLLGSALLAGFADAHAAIGALLAMAGTDALAEHGLRIGVCVAVTANSVTRIVVAFASGGARFGVVIGATMAVAVAVAWVVATALH